jgi:general secretion pathway protein N
LSSLDLDDLEATRSFPLFTPSRTPPMVAEPEPEVVFAPSPPAPPSPPSLDLIGVIMTEESADIALLRDRNTNEILRLHAGDHYDGWSLTFVDARTVELRNGDQAQTLRMFDRFDAVGDPGALGPLPDQIPSDAPVGPGDQQL